MELLKASEIHGKFGSKGGLATEVKGARAQVLQRRRWRSRNAMAVGGLMAQFYNSY